MSFTARATSISRRVVGSSAPQAGPLASLPPGVRPGCTGAGPLRRLPGLLAAIDDLLDGGLPCGRVSELAGRPSSGKTSLLVAFLAAATRRGQVAAYVDLAESLDPRSFAAAGVDLERLLWVRPPSLKDAVRCAEIILQGGGFAAVVLDLGDGVLPPGARSSAFSFSATRLHDEWSRWRAPAAALNVWLRLARAAERSAAALVVLGPRRVTGSVAVLGIEVRARPLWSVAPWAARLRQGRTGAWLLFDGLDVAVEVVRNKLGSPGRSERLLIAGRW